MKIVMNSYDPFHEEIFDSFQDIVKVESLKDHIAYIQQLIIFQLHLG